MKLSDKIWWTRISRIETERRLLSNLFHAELILVWYAFFSVVVAIWSTGIDHNLSDKYWISFSVLTLACSLYINAQSYKERANKIKNCYEALDRLCAKTTNEEKNHFALYSSHSLNAEYLKILDQCENHTPTDYYTAMVNKYYSIPTKHRARRLSPLPTCQIFCKFYLNTLIRFILLLALYLLPLMILGMNLIHGK